MSQTEKVESGYMPKKSPIIKSHIVTASVKKYRQKKIARDLQDCNRKFFPPAEIFNNEAISIVIRVCL